MIWGSWQSRSSFCAACAALLLVAACGGGGGGTVGSTPTPTPTPSPTPTPTPTPAADFLTKEYNRTTGAAAVNAIGGWTLGASGKGVTIGIVDSGIDSDSPEFTGRLSVSSADVAGSRGLDNADDDHGTNVAMVAAAARDNTGVMGIAFNATVLMMRADSPGSCATYDPNVPDSGCTFSDNNIASGVNRAVQAGARVINLSLGGSQPNSVLRAAIASAAQAGVVVVVSAGNDGDSTDPGVDPNNPDPFATGLVAAGNGNVIIVGSMNKDGVYSAFSNRAGSQANWYITAVGERVCCVYENGVMKVISNPDGTQSVYVYSGTSFSAPEVAGAAALLFQAFPNLTATQVVNLLLNNAKDAGDPGTDTTWGRGILDIGKAFAPQGTTSLAGSVEAIPLGDSTVVTSAPMGDAVNGTRMQAVVLDSYQRAYTVDLGARTASAMLSPRLARALASQTRAVSFGNSGLSLAFSVDAQGRAAALPWSGALHLSQGEAQQAQVLATRITTSLSPRTRLGLAFSQSVDGMVAQLQGRERPAFMIAAAPFDDGGFERRGEGGLALRQQLGGWGLTFSAESASALSGAPLVRADSASRRRSEGATTRLGLALDRNFGALETSLGASWLDERHTVLGARLANALGANGADTLFTDVALGWSPAPGWRLGASGRLGFTRARSGAALAGGSDLLSSAWALDVERQGALVGGDSLALRVSQPLRVERGSLRFTVPVSWDYTTLAPTLAQQSLSLAPHGREIATELAWRAPLAGGTVSTSLFFRTDPGHYATLPDDAGAALRWSSEF